MNAIAIPQIHDKEEEIYNFLRKRCTIRILPPEAKSALLISDIRRGVDCVRETEPARQHRHR